NADESHMTEGVATNAFTIENKPTRVYTLLAHKKIQEHTVEKTRNEAMKHADQLWIDLEAHMPEDRKVTRIALLDEIKSGLLLATAFELMANQLKIQRPVGISDREDGLYDRRV